MHLTDYRPRDGKGRVIVGEKMAEIAPKIVRFAFADILATAQAILRTSSRRKNERQYAAIARRAEFAKPFANVEQWAALHGIYTFAKNRGDRAAIEAIADAEFSQ